MVAQSHLLRSHLCNKLQQGDRFRLCMKISVLEYLKKKKKIGIVLTLWTEKLTIQTAHKHKTMKRTGKWEMGAI